MAFKDYYDFAEEDINNADELQSPLYHELKSQTTRFSDKHKIAEGGMKTIFSLFDTTTSRYIAMAKLHQDATSELYDQFIKEAKITALLEHPNIMPVHDVGIDDDGSPYFTMELKHGHSLSQILKHLKAKDKLYENNFQLKQLLQIFIKICEAISYSHSKKIIHRDLKPSNIQVGEFGEVVVCDWGLAKIINYEDEINENLITQQATFNELTQDGDIKGTPGYMSPEQIDEEFGAVDERTDIYALGGILYSMCYLTPPIKGQTVHEIVQKTVLGIPEIKNTKQIVVPSGLRSILQKALSLQKHDRYQTVKELMNDVIKWELGYSPLAEKSSFLQEGKLFFQRNRSICVTTAIFFSLFFVITSLFIFLQNETKQAAIQARDEAEAARNNAVKMEKIAQQAQIEAESALIRYKRTNKALQQMGSNVTDSLKTIRETFNKTIYHTPTSSVKTAFEETENVLRSIPGNKDALTFMVKLLFIQQQFSQAKNIIQNHFSEGHSLYALCEKFNEKDFSKRGRLKNVEDFAELIEDLKVFPQLAEQLVAFDAFTRNIEGKNNYGKVLENLIKAWNPEADISIEYSRYNTGHKVDLEGTKASVFKSQKSNNHGPKKNFFDYVKITYLNINQTKIDNMMQVYPLNRLQVLDIRRTKIQSLQPTNHFPALRKLIIEEGQFTKKQLSLVAKGVKIIKRDL